MITVDRTTLIESAPHQFIVDASTIGLRAGQWPRQFAVPGLGNGQDFIFTDEALEYGSHGDLLSRRYTQNLGCVTIRIYND